MISVPSLLQQLNGSRIVLLLLVGLLFFSSCGVKKPTHQRPRPKRPKTTHKKPKKKRPKVDTIDWTEIDKTNKKPTKKDDPVKDMQAKYSISMFMPLGGKSSYTEGQDESLERYINYYAGVKMALADMESSGTSFEINVFDDKVNFDKTIYSSKFKNSDIIIGPRKKDKLKKTVGIGKRDEILVVSPWWTSSKMTTDNPYYLQLNPSTTHRYEALLVHAKKHFANENIIVVQREKSSDKKRSQYFQRLNKSMDGSGAVPIEIFTVNTDSLEQGETAFDELIMMEEQRDIAVIIPNWSSKDEYYLYSCLRKLSTEKGMNNITVYAMSKALNSTLINFELYKSLQIRVAAEKYIDPNDNQVINFRQRYFSEYNAIATNDAIEGYDMMKFVGKNLIKYGKTFPSFIKQSQRMMQIKYDITSKHSKADIGKENYKNVQYYENNHVDIIEFNGNKFVRSR